MTRIDWLLARHISLHIAASIGVFFALIAMSESLDFYRFNLLTETQGLATAVIAIFAGAARWSLKVLPVTVLIGAILSVLDLKRHSEMIAMQAGGLSIWRLLKAPVLVVILGGLVISFAVDDLVTRINRSILPAPAQDGFVPGNGSQLWLEQSAGSFDYVLHAQRQESERTLSDVTIFLPAGGEQSRIMADQAVLSGNVWTLKNARLFTASSPVRSVESYEIATTSRVTDLSLKLTAATDFTFLELASALATGITDRSARAAASMRFGSLISLPALLVGALLIAFAFTAGYRRQGAYGRALVYGILLGFVVFVITEMAGRAGSAGVLDPTFAAWGPAVVAIVIGLTVLLYKEDGRA